MYYCVCVCVCACVRLFVLIRWIRSITRFFNDFTTWMKCSGAKFNEQESKKNRRCWNSCEFIQRIFKNVPTKFMKFPNAYKEYNHTYKRHLHTINATYNTYLDTFSCKTIYYCFLTLENIFLFFLSRSLHVHLTLKKKIILPAKMLMQWGTVYI